jgi:hypothetical protein
MKIIQPGGYERPKLRFLLPVRERGEAHKGDEIFPQPVVTIDDLEALAQQLLTVIEIKKS